MQVETTPCEFKTNPCQNTGVITKEQFHKKLKSALKDRLKHEGFDKYHIKVNQINTNGGNYLGELYEVEVKEIGNGRKVIDIFMKRAINGEQMLLLPVNIAHMREVFFYKDVNRIFTELQIEANIPKADRLKVVKSYDVNDPDFLILENLAKKDYKTYDRMDIVSLQYAEMSMEQLAKFHALAFVMEKKRPEYHNANIVPMKHLYLLDRPGGFDVFIKKICNSSLQHLEGRNKEGLLAYAPKYKERLRTLIMDTTSYRSCLVHGDWRPNNIMMTEENGVITDLIPIDYQLMYYGNPINDFLFFIFAGSDQPWRKQHMEYLKNYYYHQFSLFLKRFHMDSEDVYPRNEFEKDYRERLDFGLIMFLVLAPFIFAPDDDLPDFEKDLETLNFTIMDCASERVKGVIEDYVQWGFL